MSEIESNKIDGKVCYEIEASGAWNDEYALGRELPKDKEYGY